MVQPQDPTPDQRRVIDAVVEAALKTSSPVLGRSIRMKFSDRKVARDALSSCVPYFLGTFGPHPEESYQPTFAGLISSSEAPWASRAIEATVLFLGKRVRADLSAREFTLSDLRREVLEFASSDTSRIRELLRIANLTKQVIPMPGDDLRFEMPTHIEEVEQWQEYGDLRDYELARQSSRNASAGELRTKPAVTDSSREFKTAFHVYREVKQIGQGAVAIVFEVHDENQKPYALKLLRRELVETDRRKRFENEMKFCARTIHPGIIHVEDWGPSEIDGVRVPFFVTRLFPGTLRISMKAGLAHENAVSAFSQMVDALVVAHRDEVWHRDLKPENILVDESGTVVIADFGIAHFREDMRAAAIDTETGDRTGSFDYAAPEQRKRPSESSDRSDVFTLGLILNEMFTGSVPHGTGYKTIAAAAKQFAALDSLVERMIKQDPQNRPTINEVGESFGRSIEREHVMSAKAPNLEKDSSAGDVINDAPSEKLVKSTDQGQETASRDLRREFAGMRAEIERKLASLAEVAGLKTERRGLHLLKELEHAGAIFNSEYYVYERFFRLMNQAVNGATIDAAVAEKAIQMGRNLIEGLPERIEFIRRRKSR